MVYNVGTYVYSHASSAPVENLFSKAEKVFRHASVNYSCSLFMLPYV